MRQTFILFTIVIVSLFGFGVYNIIDTIDAAAQGEWMTVMLRCGSALESSGEHVTLHGSADDAKAHGDRELQSGRYDIAYVEERTGQFYTLRWVKSTSERCYGGSFREWSQDF